MNLEPKYYRSIKKMSFLKWCLDQGCLLKRGAIAEIPGCGAGIIATESVTAGVDICVVPLSLMMNVHSARQAPFWSIAQAMKIDFASDHEIVLVHLVFERNNVNSKWAPYIASVGHPMVPLLASPEELACVRGTSMHLELSKMNKAIDRLAAKMSVVVAARPGKVFRWFLASAYFSSVCFLQILVRVQKMIFDGRWPFIRLARCLCYGQMGKRQDVWCLWPMCSIIMVDQKLST
jgi:hypothetical protein